MAEKRGLVISEVADKLRKGFSVAIPVEYLTSLMMCFKEEDIRFLGVAKDGEVAIQLHEEEVNINTAILN